MSANSFGRPLLGLAVAIASLFFITSAPMVVAAPQCGDQSALDSAERVANTVRWTTASEQDNFGFDVYRGESEDGPFVKLTSSPMLGAGTSDETHHYEFRDDGIDPCNAYWYYVEDISTGGERSRFTPIIHAKAKRGVEAGADNPADE